jgi:molybdenum cofactor biosynthesis enzyme MoaA
MNSSADNSLSLVQCLDIRQNKSITSLVADFNAMMGRLRISVSHDCQLHCKFCHREGIADHWTANHISIEFLQILTESYATLGGKYVEITGGEPTLHPRISEILKIASCAGLNVILCSNGLRLDRVVNELKQGFVNQIRLSLHYGDTDVQKAHELLGNAWDFKRIERNIEEVLKTNVPIQLIFTQTKQNQHQLETVLKRALDWGVEVHIVDLIASRAEDTTNTLGYVTGEHAESIVDQFAKLERVVTDRTGSILKLYRAKNGTAWEVKDYHYGLLHSAMCKGCPLWSQCGEGIYALRVDSLGVTKPCLLRSDLEFNILSGRLPNESIPEALTRMLTMMLCPPLERRYYDAIGNTQI